MRYSTNLRNRFVMHEFELIKRYFSPLAIHPGAFSLTDDAAAFIPPEGCELVITQDAIAEGVHYIGSEAPARIAQKLLRVNLSDLAAKGATPHAYLLTCMFPQNIREQWVAGFAQGLAEDQAHYGIHLLGGDTIALGDKAAFSLTAIGSVPKGTLLRRNAAKAGDLIIVSGTIGDAALGLKVIQEDPKLSDIHLDYLIERYELPQPRMALGQALRDIAHASMDISDGLAQDMAHIAQASNLGANIDIATIPLSDAARLLVARNPSFVQSIVSGGDDYELLFTVPPAQMEVLNELAKKLTLPLTCIGRMAEGSGVTFHQPDGTVLPLMHVGYKHFS